MTSAYNQWYHPYKPDSKFSKRVAYFSMEFGIHQGLKIFSGGLGFLAGSHMRSAFELKQNMIGIGMLWKYGYYDQGRNEDQTLRVHFVEKIYSYLEDTGIELRVRIFDNPGVKVKVWVLKPEIYNTVPIYLLSTDVDGNDYLSRSITNYLYDGNHLTKIAQSIILGIGGAKLVEKLGGADIYHLNEGHGLPAFFYLKDQGIPKEKLAFTTHTPERAGNAEEHSSDLNKAGFFGRTFSETEIKKETVNGGMINYTVSALRMAKKSNGVSQLHGKVSRKMWEGYPGISEIIAITNAQNQKFWQDKILAELAENQQTEAWVLRKKELKKNLFKVVLDQTGKILDPDVLTIVWARRFAGYKRADLLLYDEERFDRLISNDQYPVQIIWAGKPYPLDHHGIGIFNRLVHRTRYEPNLAVLIDYEMALSRIMKEGSDVWLNNPRITREASGTSGMTAAMNGSINLSTNDGWIPEFQKHGRNSFILPELDHHMPVHDQDRIDCQNLYDILEKEVLPTYYDNPDHWVQIALQSMQDVVPRFGSNRMAQEYYDKLYLA